MRIFVAYGFGDKDRWVKEQVFPLISAFGFEPVDGEGLYGQVLSEAVLEQIRSCDGLIGFATLRQDGETQGNTASMTHLWVVQELAIALGQGIKLLEVREGGLDGQRGILADRHRIFYDPAKPVACFVELARALGEWHRGPKTEFLLIRDNLYRDLVAFIDREDDFKCQYRIHQKGSISSWSEGKIIPKNNRLYLVHPKLPNGSSVQIRLTVKGRIERVFLSDVERIDADSIAVAELTREGRDKIEEADIRGLKGI